MASLINQVPSVSTVFALYTSLSAITMILRNILNDLVPKKLREYITVKFIDLFSSYYQSSFTFVIEQKWEFCDNQTFRAAQVYLQSRLAGLSTGEFLVGSSDLKNPAAELSLGVPVNVKMADEFEGIHLEWSLRCLETKSFPYEKQYFHLTCKKQYREKIMKDYFPYFAKSAEKIIRHREDLYIYTYNRQQSTWQAAIFEHHTTFETLAIEPQLKTTMIDDLDAFAKGKDFFKTVGRAWKRGYLLYGPPGTGKSSMVAAIANHMNYNIYDLQIQSISDDAELRKVLTATKNRSILLIEDIDCGADSSCKRQTKKEEDVELGKKKKKHDLGISLSGLLNFVDGLWSSCGEERIIIFTTNHKEKLDPALLRPGRMDLHILMDYCTPFVLKKLVAMYLKINDHFLFDPIEKVVREVSATPAEVAQQLMASKNVDIALKGLLEFLEYKMLKKEDTKVEEEGDIEDVDTT
ncbi:PREDICTED: AAA-ATPase At1g43910-like [Camelina sativa]|uniref:AAA-ATPase At1g43910-like n=1 Tax=Camelina sativa TaxID=90675 RepID=A0ABM0ZDU0_CAMSA|nr:PREDICTED: AAA-ATPase At1g43910-like [Camelina sativa]